MAWRGLLQATLRLLPILGLQHQEMAAATAWHSDAAL
jgi:hypothetical protein